ncbi:TetR/AcrR family transcriptional regulator [Sphingobium sp. Cam5-1]|uniref:TetR/AcrR family transcriptional regulator n=1 Tax=Sphingobium sp. Cam5-1 TaxID=2789327 RepID=UPI0018AD1579|nr:TetR/AcrR family transcriptional regulator [Sphingobium sp. Cam5-1]QPI75202.1 TetR/AcrR family transcriptional regulator [Sphingobium sp. Cam5-1]
MNETSTKRRAGRPTAEVAEQKRLNLILIAVEEFARAGFHAASLRDIAEKAQVSSRTLYNHFPDKLALFAACLEYSGAQLQPDVPDLKGDLHTRLVTYATEMQRQLSSTRSMRISRLIYREGGEFDELRKIARHQFERFQVSPVAAMLEKEGASAAESRSFATQFVAMALGEWQRRLLFGGPPLRLSEMAAHARLVTGLFLNGIRSNLDKMDS